MSFLLRTSAQRLAHHPPTTPMLLPPIRTITSTTRLSARDDKPKTTKGLKPKILDEKPPPEDKLPEDVKKHNEEMSHRAERAHETVEGARDEADKAPKGMFSGVGGAAEPEAQEPR